MSVLFQNNYCCILDHENYLSTIYNKVITGGRESKPYNVKRIIFSILNSNKLQELRKRKKGSDSLIDEATMVKNMFNEAIQKIPPDLIDNIQNDHKLFDTVMVKSTAQNFFEFTTFMHTNISGGNNSNIPIQCEINNENFLLPPNSRFYCGDVTKYCKTLMGQKYDIVIADPPWWNKYIRRLKAANSKLSYSMMYNEEIASIPLKNLLADNCLVAVWCTNSPSNVAAVKDMIFPEWEVEYLTTWYWLKVSTDFMPVCEFGSGSKKQPYERIIFGKVGDVKNFPKEHLVISVPSALHSHKPPLVEVLKQYMKKENPQILELFARNLLPNTTSIGFEPLKWQHLSLYDLLDDQEEKRNEEETSKD